MVLKPVNNRSYELVNSHGNVIRRNSALLTADKTRNDTTADPMEIKCHNGTIQSNKPNVADSYPK